MSRKIKYDTDFRKSVVRKVIQKHQSCNKVAIELGLDSSMVRRWVSFFRTHGLSGIQPIKNEYTPDFKEKVIKEMRSKSLSLREACALFKIPSVGTLMNWLAKYESSGLIGLHTANRKKHKRMPKKPKKTLTKKEQLLDELASLKAENAYLKKLYALIQSDKVKGQKCSSSRN